MADTLVAVSRAAEQPLPPPPPDSVWERIERVRAERGIKYAQFDDLAGRTQGHYRGIAVRNKWSARDEVRDSYVRAAVRLGYSEKWIVLGIGERETVAEGQLPLPTIPKKKPRKPTAREVAIMLDRAQQELRDEDLLDDDEAKAVIDEVETDLRVRVGLEWEDIYDAAQGVARERAFQRERERREKELELRARAQKKTPDASFGKPGLRPRGGK